MPRNGSGIYSVPTGTAAVSGTPVASSPYNAFLADLVSDANAARPITAGGTGATDAATALSNLGGMATDADLAAIAALGYSAKSLLTKTAANTWTLTTISSNVESILGAADYAAVRTLLSLGTAALKATGTSGNTVPLLDGANTWSAANDFSALVRMGLAIGNGAPTTSGTTTTGVLARFKPGDAGMVIDVGACNAGSTYNWIQSRDPSNHATNYELRLNPNGGAVTIAGVSIPTISSTDTLSNKTLSSPTLSGTVAGSPSLSGKFSFTSLGATAVSGNGAVALGRSATNQFQGIAFTTGVAADGAIYRKASSDSIVIGFDLGGGLSDVVTVAQSGLVSITGSLAAPVAVSSETSGTLTSASANKHLALTGNITLNNSVFTANDKMTMDPGTSARTITRGAGCTMYVNGTDSATATLAANQMGGVHVRSASVFVLTGAVS